jgi:cytochrome c oxidase subunit 5a
MLVPVARRVAARALSVTTVRMGGLPHMTPEQINAAWCEYFDMADYWDLRRGVREMITDDSIPTPEICQSVLYACRRSDNLPAAIRFLEILKWRCGNRSDVYDYVMQEIEPTLTELGICTPEELGLDVVVTEY